MKAVLTAADLIKKKTKTNNNSLAVSAVKYTRVGCASPHGPKSRLLHSGWLRQMGDLESEGAVQQVYWQCGEQILTPI